MRTKLSPCTSTSGLSSGSNSTRSPSSTARTCGPIAATRAQLSRLLPRAAVAGMTMPPLLRRSPASLSSCTRTRSWSIRTAVLSVLMAFVRGGSSGRHAADEDEHPDEREHAADHLEDVVGARVAVRVDEHALDPGHLALHDVLGVGAVHELVDGRGEPVTRLLQLSFERGARALVVGHGSAPGRPSGRAGPSDGGRAAARRTPKPNVTVLVGSRSGRATA